MIKDATTHFTFPAETTKKFVTLEFALLVRHHSGHFEDEPGLWLLVQSDGIVRDHPCQGGVVHHFVIQI